MMPARLKQRVPASVALVRTGTLWGCWGPERGMYVHMQEPLEGCCVSSGVELGKPTHFTVNTKAAGKGKLDVQFSGLAKGDAVRDVDIIDHHDNTYTVKYTPVQQVASSLDNALWPHPSVHLLSLRAPSRGGLGGWLQETLCPLWFLTWDRVGTAVGGSNVSDHPTPMPELERHRTGELSHDF